MRHGPHHGAQKSTSSGTALLFAAASKTAESPISIGDEGAPIGALQ
jgi:hypothetical protein